jgi:hypothetical protein
MGLYRAFVQQVTTSAFPNTSTVAAVAVTATSSVILANRPAGNRRGFTIENNGTVAMIFGYGATVSSAVRTIKLEPGDFFEDTFNWQGAISGMTVTGTGTVNIAELTII